jgi:hypothetical protein
MTTVAEFQQEANGAQVSSKDDRSASTTPVQIIRATPYVWRDPSAIPRRRWLYGQHLIRRFGSATIAHPGAGKSALVLAEALAMSTNRNLLGIQPLQRCRVWYWNGEDPQEETERRIAAACIHYGITRTELDGWLFTDSGRDQEIVIAHQTRDGATLVEPVVDQLMGTIRANNIDVVSIDPFISSHRVTENDNNAIDVVAKRWTAIADQANCAIDLVHHSRKTGGAEVTVEDGRGAVALLAAVRSARVLNTMSADDGRKYGLAFHRTYFRADNGKANLAPPPENASWFQIKSVCLGNGDPENLMDQGDSVGVVAPWSLPDPLAGITGADFDKIAAIIRGGRWRENPQANGWAGEAVAQGLGLNLDNRADKAKATGLLKHWIGLGTLRVVKGMDAKSNERKFIEVSDAIDD